MRNIRLMNVHIGEKLRLWRTTEGFTLEEAAPVIGLSVSYISELENGEKELSRNVIKKYVEASKATKIKLSANDLIQ